MLEFILKQRALLAVLSIAILWSVLFTIWTKWIRTIPLNEEITLIAGSTIEKEVRIVIPELYRVNFLFDRTGAPDKDLRSLVGNWGALRGKVIPSGVIIPIQWSLHSSKNGAVVATDTINSFGSAGYTSNNFYRPAGHFKAPTGRYFFKATILRDVPEFKNIKTRISLEPIPGFSSTWQLTLAFWGDIVTVLLVLPIALVLGLLLLWRASRAFYARNISTSGAPKT
ncbi:DUF5625 family protein [Pseudomonas sp. LS44]|uniref:DUF5625 family protein n=1 Tax=Pseudomonas sp. LS44 TaxID=1357074 RepID=UPI00215B1FCE|nr:DUF5625 family protein [Pseudomonas sp. LS44]UVE16325.1 DUF5625 family protein [Pseudomonas sp. LS44]